jgi:hypothetical protein
MDLEDVGPNDAGVHVTCVMPFDAFKSGDAGQSDIPDKYEMRTDD